MPRPVITWVLIADGSRARLFVNEGVGKGLKPVLGQQFIGTKLPSRDIATDRPGRAFDSAGEGRHAMEPPTDPHRHEKQAFAHELADVLEDRRKRSTFDRLVVVAPPEALGDLRSEFSDQLRRLVTAELNNDLTKISIHELSDHLGEVMAV